MNIDGYYIVPISKYVPKKIYNVKDNSKQNKIKRMRFHTNFTRNTHIIAAIWGNISELSTKYPKKVANTNGITFAS